MSIARFLISYMLLNIFGLLVAVFLAQNIRVEHIAFFGLVFSLNFVWILLGAAGFGFLLASLVLVPGRIATSIHSWGLNHEAEQLEQQVAMLQEQREHLLTRHEALMANEERTLIRYQRLLADHSQVVAERDLARAQLARLDTIPTARAALTAASTS